jgi:hypothetical protein
VSCFRRDGRLLVRVPLPADVVERADELAKRSGRDRCDVLGDLVAQQLPDILVAAARDAFGHLAGSPEARNDSTNDNAPAIARRSAPE